MLPENAELRKVRVEIEERLFIPMEKIKLLEKALAKELKDEYQLCKEHCWYSIEGYTDGKRWLILTSYVIPLEKNDNDF